MWTAGVRNSMSIAIKSFAFQRKAELKTPLFLFCNTKINEKLQRRNKNSIIGNNLNFQFLK